MTNSSELGLTRTSPWVHCAFALSVLTLGCQRTLPVVDEDQANTSTAGSGAKTASAVFAGTAGDANKVVARAVANISPLADNQITGQVKFEQTANGGVVGTAHLNNCMPGKTYYVAVRAGHGCGSKDEIGSRWNQDHDGTFGRCSGSGDLWAYGVHIAQPTLPSDWSIGGSSKTDVVGHAVIVTLDNELVSETKDLACGVVQKTS